jgi:hypothetical protein
VDDLRLHQVQAPAARLDVDVAGGREALGAVARDDLSTLW